MRASLLNVLSVAASMLLLSSAKKAKRVALGDPVESHERFNTQFVVALIDTWACISDQYNHQMTGCQFGVSCTGSLLTEDFVITAAHCVISVKYDQVPQWQTLRAQGGVLRTGIYIFYRYLIVRERSDHFFYSSISVLAGSAENAKMTQKRHAFRAFPHPIYEYNTEGKWESTHHDIALLRVCRPFELNQFVKPAPMKALDQLKPHWDSIISRNAACLFTGFGSVFNHRKQQLQAATELHYTWRYVTCSSMCNTLPDRTFEQIRNPCQICSSPIRPRMGIPQGGDSGSPVVCDGFYSAIHSAGVPLTSELIKVNRSEAHGYALHCIDKAITPQQLEYYRTIKGGSKEIVKLGPVDYTRNRRHAIILEDEESFH